MTTQELLPSETVLPDDYPVYADYIYLMNGVPIRSDIEGTVRQLKRALIQRRNLLVAPEIRRCNIAARAARR